VGLGKEKEEKEPFVDHSIRRVTCPIQGGGDSCSKLEKKKQKGRKGHPINRYHKIRKTGRTKKKERKGMGGKVSDTPWRVERPERWHDGGGVVQGGESWCCLKTAKESVRNNCRGVPGGRRERE